MFAPIFSICAASTAVKAELGASPVRLYPFGFAPQGVELPYAVWQQVGGAPENFIGGVPDIDLFAVQVDVYATTETEARDAAKALRDAIEPHAHITRWGGEWTDPDTLHKRYSFDVDWHVKR